MPTRTLGIKATENLNQVSRCTSRVPLEALQMLTQSVSKCNQDYIQPLPFKEDDQKKSPLALLAATCSSIGKTEPSKETAEPEEDNTSRASKISEGETRSSFKPYKQTAGEKRDEMSAEKAGFRAPNKDNSTSISPVANGKEERSKNSALQYPLGEDTHCGHSQTRACGMFLDSPQQTALGTHSLLKDCGAGCPHPGSVLPFKSGGIQPYPLPLGQDSSALKTHGLPTTLPMSFPTSFPQCGCGFCTPHSVDSASPSLALNSINARSLQLHNPASTPYMDYLQRTVCRDVNCTNCKPQFSPYGFPSPVTQCGPHCIQCEKSEPTPQSPFTCFYPHSKAMYKPGTQDETHPYVCNWVSGSKHCGKSFSTSEDLFQHLRTHTQVGSQVGTSYTQPACNVHGCPCKMRASPLQSSFNSARYRPYYYKPTTFPQTPAGCYSPYPLHGFDPHRLFK